MNNKFIVAFLAGSSGRLIANLIYTMITERQYEFEGKLSPFNSTHEFSPFTTSFHFYDMKKARRPFFHPDFYNHIRFTSSTSPGVIIAHTFPNWEIIRDKFPDTKIVLISFTHKDYLEIIGNNFLKNDLEGHLVREKYRQNLSKESFARLVKKILNISVEELDPNQLTMEVKRKMIIDHAMLANAEYFSSGYMNPIIPKDFTDKTLVLKYNDMVTNSKYILDTLSNFTNKTYSDDLVKLYDNYLLGRKQLIKNHMPWINEQ